jgi:hypothetical protein
MKADERDEICSCIRDEIHAAFNDFKFDIQDYVKNAIDALKANTEVGVRAIRKLDDISKQLEEFD